MIMRRSTPSSERISIHEASAGLPTVYDAFIAMGGPQHVGANDRYPYLPGVEAAIRRAVEEDIPYLGLCLGGQLLAHALGAPVSRHHVTEIGFSRIELTEEGKNDPLFQGLPGYQQVIHWHEDTFDIPGSAVQLASGAITHNQAFRFGRRAYGTQYHIELTPGMLDTWLSYPEYKRELINALGVEGADRFMSDRDKLYPLFREHTRIMFENFLRIGGVIC
jgi:GMP synthase (glutamine-hydrolysing)